MPSESYCTKYFISFLRICAWRSFLINNTIQGVKQNILKHHKRFTDKTLNHITYMDKELWGPPDDTLKQKILNDAKKNKHM
jgi:hypothetical protein